MLGLGRVEHLVAMGKDVALLELRRISERKLTFVLRLVTNTYQACYQPPGFVC